jgi:arylsulfatase A
MKLLLILSIILFLSSCSAGYPTRPNFIVFLADDLGIGDISPTNQEIDYTPNLQALANDSVLMTSFYVPASVCTPVRSAILTGRHPARDGLLKVIMPGDGRGLDQGTKTLPESLAQLDYRTGLIGKWHLGEGITHHPLSHGFDYYYGLPFGHDTPKPEIWENWDVVDDYPDLYQLTSQFTARAIDFIETTNNQPFFLMLAYTQPHVPLFVANEGQTGQGLYADAIAEIDQSIGDILAATDENTVVIFLSDNGPYQPGHLEVDNDLPFVKYSIHEPWMKDGSYLALYPEAAEAKRWVGGNATGDFISPRLPEYETMTTNRHLIYPTGKYSVFEGGVRVPFMARLPGYAPTILDQPVIAMDLYPTIIELAGGFPGKSDGVSLLSLWNGGQRPGDTFHFYRPDGSYGAIRYKSWKLHLGLDWTLIALYHTYNTQEDRNLISNYPDVAAALFIKAMEFDDSIRITSLYLPVIARNN